ncbi:MAG: HD domain-containing protein [Myxococcota bacterium]
MNRRRLALPAASDVMQLARALARAGGRLVVVGGFVRDALRGRPSHDVDLEVFGLSPDAVEAVLVGFGFSPRVGRLQPVWRRVRDGLDLGWPRAGALELDARDPSSLERAFRAASRHRDLTLNAIGWDPLDERLLDPWLGEADLAAQRLRAVDAATFGADPLRLLRVARLQALLEASVEPSLVALCRGLDLADVAVERIAGELRRMLLDLPRPSRAFAWLASIGRLDVFPPLAALVGIAQDPDWHPEGDVFVHTLLVIDRARELGEALDPAAREILLIAALCHDLGKSATTREEAGRVHALGHEAVSARLARAWLTALRFPERVVGAVEVLIEHHRAPAQLVAGSAGARAYRRLARKLDAGGETLIALERLARADQLGRTTEAARAGRFDAGAAFLAAAEAAQVEATPRPDVVSAPDLMARGIAPGPELGRLLRRCREIEDETGETDPEVVLSRCLGGLDRGAHPPSAARRPERG